MNIKRTITTLAAALLVAASFAQGGFGGGQGRGFGRGFGGGNPAFLLRDEQVRAELKITDEQKSKLDELQSSMQEEMRSAFQGAGGDQAAMRKTMTTLMEGMAKKVNAILTPEQQQRLKEINIQQTGNSVVMQKDIQKDLGLKEEQIKKLADLQKKQQDANQSIFQKMRDGEIEREQVQELMTKNAKALDAEIDKVLTDEQKKKLKEMAGKPFKRKDDTIA